MCVCVCVCLSVYVSVCACVNRRGKSVTPWPILSHGLGSCGYFELVRLSRKIPSGPDGAHSHHLPVAMGLKTTEAGAVIYGCKL